MSKLRPPFSIGQNAAEYGRKKTPRPRGRAWLSIAVVVVVLVAIYLAVR